MKIKQVFGKLKFMVLALSAMMMFSACGSDDTTEVLLMLKFDSKEWTELTDIDTARPVWRRAVVEVFEYAESLNGVEVDNYDDFGKINWIPRDDNGGEILNNNGRRITLKRHSEKEFRSSSDSVEDDMVVRINVPTNKAIIIKVECIIPSNNIRVGYGYMGQNGRFKISGDDDETFRVINILPTKEVRFNLDGGRFPGSIRGTVNNIDGSVSLYAKPGETLEDHLRGTIPLKTGEAFIGWECSQGDEFAEDEMISSDIELTAIYDARPPLTYTGRTLPNGQVDEAYLDDGSPVSVGTATGSDDITYTIRAGDRLPNGLTMLPNGIITGTPEEVVTNHRFTVIASDDEGVHRDTPANFFITITALPALTFQTSATLPPGTEDEPYTPMNIVATAPTGTPTITYVITDGAVPAGLTFNNGLLGGTPTVVVTDHKFTVTASASGFQEAEREFSITINAAGTPPTFNFDYELYSYDDAIGSSWNRFLDVPSGENAVRNILHSDAEGGHPTLFAMVIKATGTQLTAGTGATKTYTFTDTLGEQNPTFTLVPLKLGSDSDGNPIWETQTGVAVMHVGAQPSPNPDGLLEFGQRPTDVANTGGLPAWTTQDFFVYVYDNDAGIEINFNHTTSGDFDIEKIVLTIGTEVLTIHLD
jgi:hypothetical protein